MRSKIPKVRDVRIVSLDFLYALTWESKFEQLASNRSSSDGSTHLTQSDWPKILITRYLRR